MPTFKRLSASDVMRLYDMGDEVLVALKEKYAEVFTNQDHPRRTGVALRIRIEAELIPAILHAWVSVIGTPPMTGDDLLDVPYDDLLAYAREVRRVNPFLEHLPEPTDDPNPTPAAS